HWDESARDLVRGILHYLHAINPGDKSIVEVRSILTLPGAELEALMRDQIANCPDEIARRMANAFLSKPDRERGSVLSTAIRHTSFLDEPRMQTLFSESTFDISSVKHEPTTVYLIVPPEKIHGYYRFI